LSLWLIFFLLLYSLLLALIIYVIGSCHESEEDSSIQFTNSVREHRQHQVQRVEDELEADSTAD